MLRRYFTASVAASVVLLAPVAAHAISSPVVSRVGLPAGFSASAGETGCADSPVGSISHVTGPGTPPHGAGSLQLNAGAGSAEEIQYDLTSVAPSNLTGFVIHSYLPANGAPFESFIVTFLNDSSDSNVFYQGRLAIPSEVDAWESTDFIASSEVHWTGYNASTQQFSDLGDSSYATFIGSHSVSLDHLTIETDTCPLSGTPIAGHLNLDDFSITISSATTEYDFEAAVATKLVGHLSPTTIAYAHAITPSATLTSDGAAFANQNVSLWAKPATATSFAKVGTAKTNASGVATAAAQHPTKNTAYQWRYAGDGVTFGPSTSSSLTVHVGSKLSINAPARVKKGKSFTATGVMTPKHKGDVITLFATKAGHTKRVATGKVHGDGSYSLSGKLKKAGRYKIFTTAAADSTNAKGTSPKKSLRVH